MGHACHVQDSRSWPPQFPYAFKIIVSGHGRWSNLAANTAKWYGKVPLNICHFGCTINREDSSTCGSRGKRLKLALSICEMKLITMKYDIHHMCHRTPHSITVFFTSLISIACYVICPHMICNKRFRTSTVQLVAILPYGEHAIHPTWRANTYAM